MIVSTSNALNGTTPTVTTGASSDLPSNVTDPDFSTNYTGTSKQWLVFEFGALANISYVMIAGVIVKGSGNGLSSIQINDGSEIVRKAFLTRDNVAVFSFDERIFSNLKITLKNATIDKNITVSYIAAGSSLTLPNNGEHGGHSRAWQNRSIKSKTTTNALSAPVAVVLERKQQAMTLSIPNTTKSFSAVEWQTFLDFAQDNLFAINEDPDNPVSSYLCYELNKATTKAHSQTRALNNLSIGFKVFTGI